MELTELLERFLKSTDSKEIDALRAWLQSAVVLARAQVAGERDTQLLTKHFADLPPQEALRLTGFLDQPTGENTYVRLEALREAQAAAATHAPEIYHGLSTLHIQVNKAAKNKRRWLLGGAALKTAAYALPVAFAFLCGLYFRFYNNVYWESDAMLSPPATYEIGSVNYDIDPGYSDRFFQEFPRYYFSRDNSFVAEFIRGRLGVPASFTRGNNQTDSSTGDESSKAGLFVNPESNISLSLRAIKLRVLFRNPRRAEPILVTSIETRATYHRQPFDWSKVDVSTNLSVEDHGLDTDAGYVSLSDRGIGPAMDVNYTAKADGMTLYSRSFPYLLNRTEMIYIRSTNGGVTTVLTESGTSRILNSPAYWFVREQPRPQSESRGLADDDRFVLKDNMLFCSDRREYEIVKDADRLAELTKTVQGGQARVDVTYASLRNETASKTIEITLPANVVFVQADGKLSNRNPCLPPTAGMIPGGVKPPPGVAAFIDRVAGGETPLVKGIDLIKAESSLDLSGVPDGGVIGAVASPSEILGTGGFLMFELTIGNTENGTIDLEFFVNGTRLRATKVQFLVPDSLKFSQADIGRFRPNQDAALIKQ